MNTPGDSRTVCLGNAFLFQPTLVNILPDTKLKAFSDSVDLWSHALRILFLFHMTFPQMAKDSYHTTEISLSQNNVLFPTAVPRVAGFRGLQCAGHCALNALCLCSS